MDRAALLTEVDRHFGESTAGAWSWPHPHPDRAPLDAEYSRCVDPDKYRIVGLRARAWVSVLAARGALVQSAAPASHWWADEPHPAHQDVLRVTSPRAGAVPLVLGLRDFDGALESVLEIGAGDPAVVIHHCPPCGCDACDDGSAPLLHELDRHVLAVVTGVLVHVRVDGGHAQSIEPGLWSASNAACELDVESLLDAAREGRSPFPTVFGLPWWG